jgi:hypothetical protein
MELLLRLKMSIQTSLINLLNLFAKPVTLENAAQAINSFESCPAGYDIKRTRVAISKVGKKDKGNFVQVYYRNNRAKQLVANNMSKDTLGKELDELVETSRSKSGGNPRIQAKIRRNFAIASSHSKR